MHLSHNGAFFARKPDCAAIPLRIVGHCVPELMISQPRPRRISVIAEIHFVRKFIARRVRPCPEEPVLKLRYFVNREAMASTSPGRKSEETAKSERHRVPEGRPADPDKISVVPPGLRGGCCSLTMDLRPWLLHVMPSAFKNATSESAGEGCDSRQLIRESPSDFAVV